MVVCFSSWTGMNSLSQRYCYFCPIMLYKYCDIDSTGFVIDFIPFPVISGFTSAAAITIALGQVKVHLTICFLSLYLDIFL